VAPGFVRGPKQSPLPPCELPFTEMKRGKNKGGSSTGAPQRGATQQGPPKKETPQENTPQKETPQKGSSPDESPPDETPPDEDSADGGPPDEASQEEETRDVSKEFDPVILTRPGHGSQGEHYKLLPNYFEVRVESDLVLWEYSISVEDPIPKSKIEKQGKDTRAEFKQPTGKKMARIIDYLLYEHSEIKEWRAHIVTDYQQVLPGLDRS